jgi:hypothetical protein
VKKWYKSKTIIGSIIVLIGAAAGGAGYAFTPEDQQAALNLLTSIIEGIGGLIAIYGRIVAVKNIA